MKFAHINMLFFIWLLPVMALVIVYGWRKRRRILKSFAGQRTLMRIAPESIGSRRLWGTLLIISAALLTIIAMTGPQYGFQWQEIERRGVDIIIALDCSRSMLAGDLKPNRLDRAKREIYDLLNMLEGDRVGLVAFSGTAFLQCPLTIDYQAFYLFLDVLTPDYLPLGGSDLTAALATAGQAFDPKSTAEKAIILITDGEHTGTGDPLKAAQEARKAGIKLFCIGVGAGDGVPIPAGQGGFKKDATGRIVMSRLDESLLTRMALTTGGTYVRSVAGDMDLDTIYRNQIRSDMQSATVESRRKQVWADRFQWPLTLAVLLLFIQKWMPLVKRPLAVLLPLLALLAASQTPANADPLQKGYKAYQQGQYDQALKQFIDGQLKDPENPQILYNIGNAYYKKGDYDAAREHFSQALPKASADLKPQLLYNLGNTAFRQGDMQAAVKNYEAALKLSPEDTQARENLSFAKQQLQQQKQQSDSQAENQKDQQQPDSQAENKKDQQQPDSQAENKKDQQQSDSQAKNQKNQTQSGSRENPQEPGAQQPPPPTSSPTDDSEQKNQQQDQQASPQQPDEPPAKEAVRGENQPRPSTEQPVGTQMLNRLKDQPGRAMMPAYQKRQVDKDW